MYLTVNTIQSTVPWNIVQTTVTYNTVQITVQYNTIPILYSTVEQYTIDLLYITLC